MRLDLEKRSECMHASRENLIVLDSFAKAYSVLSEHYAPAVAVSGGKDSDIMLDLISRLDTEKKVRYIWCDTGLEYQATKRHLDDLEKKYEVKIERIKAQKPIPLSCKEYGVPFLSKFASEMIERLQRHGFQWEDEDYETLLKKYPKCKGALSWWNNNREVGEHGYSMFNINYNKGLKEFMIANPPQFNISSKCCTYAKKNVAHSFIKENDIDLMIIGVRKAEGGIRAASYKTCYDRYLDDEKCDNYRPLFWYTNEDEKDYERIWGVTHSDCYKLWGFTRTGCVGCPFNRKFYEELEIVREREPQMFKACQHVFGVSYDYTTRYRRFQQAFKDGKLLEIDGIKYCLDDLLEEDYHIREVQHDLT